VLITPPGFTFLQPFTTDRNFALQRSQAQLAQDLRHGPILRDRECLELVPKLGSDTRLQDCDFFRMFCLAHGQELTRTHKRCQKIFGAGVQICMPIQSAVSRCVTADSISNHVARGMLFLDKRVPEVVILRLNRSETLTGHARGQVRPVCFHDAPVSFRLPESSAAFHKFNRLRARLPRR
jgi:hypothetical protein